MPIEIQYTGNNTWDVYFNWTLQTGVNGHKTVSTSNPPYSEQMVTGSESTSASNTLTDAYSSGLEYYTTGGTWTSQWGTGTQLACVSGVNTAKWISTDHELQNSQG